MTNGETFALPASGLAEEILAQFMVRAQQEVDQVAFPSAEEQVVMLMHLVTFRLGREEYGVEIDRVREIIRASDITPVPGAPTHVRGVINIRGKIVPVVDLGARFGLGRVTAGDEQRIIVVELGEKRIGMLVDSVSQVIKLPAGVIEEMPQEAVGVEESFIKGVGKLESRLIIILDLTRSLLAT